MGSTISRVAGLLESHERVGSALDTLSVAISRELPVHAELIEARAKLAEANEQRRTLYQRLIVELFATNSTVSSAAAAQISEIGYECDKFIRLYLKTWTNETALTFWLNYREAAKDKIALLITTMDSAEQLVLALSPNSVKDCEPGPAARPS